MDEDFWREYRRLETKPEIPLPAYLEMLRGMYIEGLVPMYTMELEGKRWILDCAERCDPVPPLVKQDQRPQERGGNGRTTQTG